MTNLPTLPWDAVSEHDRKIVTTSLMVAEVFGKNHRHVLRDIQQLGESKSGFSSEQIAALGEPRSGLSSDPIVEFSRLNFQPRNYVSEQNKTLPMIEMTKNGFTLLVMGYTGEKAMLFKIAYIAEFDRMAERLAHDDFRKALAAERAYFERYPVDRQIRNLAMVGEPYWFIGRIVDRAAATVGNAVRRMLKWGMMDARSLTAARTGMAPWWRHRRKYANQLTLGI